MVSIVAETSTVALRAPLIVPSPVTCHVCTTPVPPPYWANVCMEMSVAYESDLRKAFQVIADATAKLPELMPGKVIETPKVMGLESMDDSCLRVRIETKVSPGCHFDAKRALNLLLVEGFRDNNLEIPYPKAVEISMPGDAPASHPPEPSKGSAAA